MNALLIVFFAAICSAAGNLIFRVNAAQNSQVDTTKSYLLFFYSSCFLISLAAEPALWSQPFNFTMFSIGGVVGLINVSLMLVTAKALQKGPSGLTFAFQSASSIMPGMLLFMVFGTPYGFSFGLWQLGGICLVLLGLVIGSMKGSGNDDAKQKKSASLNWLKYALAVFFIQVVALSLIQGRCVLFDCAKVGGFLSQFALNKADDIWFMPGQFGISMLFQSFLVYKEKQSVQKSAFSYGVLGGIFFFLATFLLLWATKVATPEQKAILFPFSAVSTIIMCNLWAKILYKEKFNLTSNALCTCGIFLAL